MQKYIDQLIEDLIQVAEKPQKSIYIETPPHLEEHPYIAELALVPFKSISEWTGIEPEVFPESYELSVLQCEQVIETIFKVFDTFQIELIDAPEDIPPEDLYDAITFNWDFPVQYLPSSGFELELCTGDPLTCWYGEHCDCGEEQDFSDDETPSSNLDEDIDFELPF